MGLRRASWPSVCPLPRGVGGAARTAAPSRSIPAAKVSIAAAPRARASAIQASRALRGSGCGSSARTRAAAHRGGDAPCEVGDAGRLGVLQGAGGRGGRVPGQRRRRLHEHPGERLGRGQRRRRARLGPGGVEPLGPLARRPRGRRRAPLGLEALRPGRGVPAWPRSCTSREPRHGVLAALGRAAREMGDARVEPAGSRPVRRARGNVSAPAHVRMVARPIAVRVSPARRRRTSLHAARPSRAALRAGGGLGIGPFRRRGGAPAGRSPSSAGKRLRRPWERAGQRSTARAACRAAGASDPRPGGPPARPLPRPARGCRRAGGAKPRPRP